MNPTNCRHIITDFFLEGSWSSFVYYTNWKFLW